MATLSECFDRQSSASAIVIPASKSHPKPIQISYASLDSQILSFQKQLARLGINKGSVVSIALPNSLEFAIAFLATTRQRAVAAPLNPAYQEDEFRFYLGDVDSSLCLVPKDAVLANIPAVRASRHSNVAVAECFIGRAGVVLDLKSNGKYTHFHEDAERLEAAKPDDVALILHTSGTTGRPKAVPLSHHNLTKSIANINMTYDLSTRDRTLLVMPLFHVHGLLAAFLAPLRSGGTIIVPERFSASEFWRDFSEWKANWYTAVPTIHQILLRSPKPTPMPDIRFIRSCSSPLAPKTFHELQEIFKAPVLEAYAMTEAAHQMASNPLPPGRRLPGSVGIAQGVEIKILDQKGDEVSIGTEAEICVRGDNVTGGYLNNPEANKSSFTHSGFFRTGDQGKMDEDGYIMITGRIKELINKGGEKISPVELDNIVSQHPTIAEAVTFAIKDDIYGQDIGVAIVLKGKTRLGSTELIQWLKPKVAKFKLPKKIYFTEVMPKTATGKVQRRMVADEMEKRSKSASKL